MNRISNHINLIIICSSTIGLTAYCHQAMHQDMHFTFMIPFLISLIQFHKYPSVIRPMYCVTGLLAVVAVFLQNRTLSLIVASCSLGFSLCLGYLQVNRIELSQEQIHIKIYEGSLNISLAFGVLLSTINNIIDFSLISVKLMVLVTTLPNFYLPVSEYYREKQIKDKTVNNKLIYTLTPLYVKQWTYSIGYSVGVYLNTFKILALNKQGKFLVVGLLILIEMLTYKQQIKLISELLRAILIYHFQRNTNLIEGYFIGFYLCLRIYFTQQEINIYLMIGYVAIALYLWRNEYQQQTLYIDRQPPLEASRSDYEMKIIKSDNRFSKNKLNLKE